ncbi:PLP-dependent aminotransferase family protein [Pseudomonas rhizosphaerae]|uniref:PLP-dependent aminotransferase family protein n=1 Tax=Pseudomonas rhizosphaerae TaxID=216142 RepID=UPI002B46CFBC|nr:PLP-dependent aminotransferase family protein [Pseudomonas rhizosphaerae]MEB2870116.1 PLP-dependent aminotransferase family protein [Pseudomonas rhizosphaerae]
MNGAAKDKAGAFAYQGVYRYLLRLIDGIDPGERTKLPSLRALGRTLDVSVSTVQAAYGMLEAEGRIEPIAKSGYYARGSTVFGPALASPDLLQRVLAGACQSDMDVFGRAAPAPRADALKALLRFEVELARRYPAGLCGVVQPCGELELRHAVATRYTRCLDDHWCADDVYIGSDLLNVLHMAWNAMQLQGAVVVVLVPCGWRILRTLQQAGARVVELALDAQGRVPLQRLQEVLAGHQVRLMVLGASFHAPHGTCIDDADKRTIASLLDRHGVWVAEDDTEGDLCFQGTLRFRDLVAPQRLLIFGSLHHLVGAEAPFAYLLSRHWQVRLQQYCLQRTTVAPPLRHKVLARFISGGSYDDCLGLQRDALQRQVSAFITVLHARLHERLQLASTAGGACVWARSRVPVDMRSVFEDLRRQRLLIAPGGIFSLQGHCHQHLRLNGCGHSTEQWERCATALSAALEAHGV